ncbi:hypothetical protein A0U40_17610 [[Bacillus] sp. KCTC 13219]|nr:hypothetical protein A0U40_17610 [[Bacillus] sp. KCTC 13219]
MSDEQWLLITNRINDLHETTSNEWIKKQEIKYNLKRKQVRHICSEKTKIDQSFLDYMNFYCDELMMVQFSETLLDLSSEYNLTTRIKHPDSRISKMLHYRFYKLEQGSVNLNKCLNDLFGLRIIVNDFEHSKENVMYLDNLLEKSNIKVHNSCKNEYKATHLYFNNGNNLYFPWELQIWNSIDYEANIKSHAEHKQGYTKWPNNYQNKRGEEAHV